MVDKCFNEKTSDDAVKSKIMLDHELPEEMHKPNIKIVEKQKVHSSLFGVLIHFQWQYLGCWTCIYAFDKYME